MRKDGEMDGVGGGGGGSVRKAGGPNRQGWWVGEGVGEWGMTTL